MSPADQRGYLLNRIRSNKTAMASHTLVVGDMCLESGGLGGADTGARCVGWEE